MYFLTIFTLVNNFIYKVDLKNFFSSIIVSTLYVIKMLNGSTFDKKQTKLKTKKHEKINTPSIMSIIAIY
jgi:hypothetical protein